MPALTNLSRNLRNVCDANKVTQRELARRTGVSYVYINRIFQGTAEPTISTCEAIANALGLSVVALLADPVENFSKAS